MEESLTSVYREVSAARLPEFVACGYKQRHFFPHRIYYLPKAGPDGLKLAHRMCGESRPENLWEVVLYAISPVLEEFPGDVFFDDDLIWHQQQFGKGGQVASANLAVQSKTMHTMVHISDLVQRAARRPEHRTRIQNRFRGWPHMLLNAILHFALERGIETIYVPTSELAMEHTDPKRIVQNELFERVYDRALHQHLRADRQGRWWRVDVNENREQAVVPQKARERINVEKTICILHWIERGLGHRDVAPQFAEAADDRSPAHLEEMLALERAAGVKATYSVVGCILRDVRQRIEAGGHCVSFHSYDHDLQREQLRRCRQIDYRIKGYSPPRSKLTSELTHETLCYHNFEWLASSWHSFDRLERPAMERGLVKVPIRFDDFALYKQGLAYAEWEASALTIVRENGFVAFGLHDCYGDRWLPAYGGLLEKLRSLGRLRTMDEVAFETILASAG